MAAHKNLIGVAVDVYIGAGVQAAIQLNVAQHGFRVAENDVSR